MQRLHHLIFLRFCAEKRSTVPSDGCLALWRPLADWILTLFLHTLEDGCRRTYRCTSVLQSQKWPAESIRHRILKRRLAWLIGQWVSSDEDCAKLPFVWQILVHLLAERGEATDLAVNLSAAVAIKDCVDVSIPISVLRMTR